MEKEKKEKITGTPKSGSISRREFLKDAGLIVGGATVGSMTLLSACAGGETATATVTQTATKTVTQTVTQGGSTVTVTPPTTGAEVISFTVNNVKYYFTDLKPSWSLGYVLREKLGLIGTKLACNRGECGACTVIMNGKAVYSCVLLAVECEGATIETVEGLGDAINLTGIQKAIYDTDALQCGYCAPGFLMASKALLAVKPKPTMAEVKEALSGHLCTCGNTKFYIDAVLKV